MTQLKVMGVLVVMALLAACSMTESTAEPTGAEPPAADAPAVETITLERQPCFGFCPVYTLTIHGDGRVEFNGQQNVEAMGEQTATIDPAAVQALADEMDAAGYFTWNDAYMTQDVTDLPYVISSITLSDGTTKRIEHYHGDFSAPEMLTALEDQIDAVADTAQWVGATE